MGSRSHANTEPKFNSVGALLDIMWRMSNTLTHYLICVGIPTDGDYNFTEVTRKLRCKDVGVHLKCTQLNYLGLNKTTQGDDF